MIINLSQGKLKLTSGREAVRCVSVSEHVFTCMFFEGVRVTAAYACWRAPVQGPAALVSQQTEDTVSWRGKIWVDPGCSGE